MSHPGTNRPPVIHSRGPDPLFQRLIGRNSDFHGHCAKNPDTSKLNTPMKGNEWTCQRFVFAGWEKCCQGEERECKHTMFTCFQRRKIRQEPNTFVEFSFQFRLKNSLTPETSSGTATITSILVQHIAFSSAKHTYSLLESFSDSCPLQEPEALVPRWDLSLHSWCEYALEAPRVWAPTGPLTRQKMAQWFVWMGIEGMRCGNKGFYLHHIRYWLKRSSSTMTKQDLHQLQIIGGTVIGSGLGWPQHRPKGHWDWSYNTHSGPHCPHSSSANNTQHIHHFKNTDS